MKAVILAGGVGTRLSEETALRPKPLVEIGGKPILWHIMKIYAAHGVNEFIICCGYMGAAIKKYFANYSLYMSDVTFDLRNDQITVHQSYAEPWLITCVNTGRDTQTGGRLKRVRDFLRDENEFCFTYGDGVGDVNITELISYHRSQGKLATLTATRPPGRYGALKFSPCGRLVDKFQEKPEGDGSWINGGFFVLSPSVIDRIEGDTTSWEGDPLAGLARDGELSAYCHDGFWQPMDTLRDKNHLNKLWTEGAAKWKVWD